MTLDEEFFDTSLLAQLSSYYYFYINHLSIDPAELQKASPLCHDDPSTSESNASSSSTSSSTHINFPQSTKRYAVGMARTSKLDFFQHLDIGVPMDLPTDGDSDVLLLYSTKRLYRQDTPKRQPPTATPTFPPLICNMPYRTVTMLM